MSLLSNPSTRAGVNTLLDQLHLIYDLTTDAQLAQMLALYPSMISKLRAGSPLTPALVVRIHECTNLPLATIIELASRDAADDPTSS